MTAVGRTAEGRTAEGSTGATPATGHTTDAALEPYRGWLLAVAATMTRPQLVEDLAQEGWVAMWRALQSFDPARGALPSWLTRKALWRMRTCIADEAWLGRPARHLGRGAIRDTTEYATDDPLLERLADDNAIEAAMWAYHQGEVLAAVARLSPAQRRYVYLRFWRGLRGAELAQEFGYEPHALWTSQRNGARQKLRDSLARLGDVVVHG